MAGLYDTPPKSDSHLTICPSCGERYPAIYGECPHCTIRMHRSDRPETQHLKRKPTILPAPPRRRDQLDPSETVLLQFLPSASCITLPLERPTVLGRLSEDSNPSEYAIIDLSSYGAHVHGVSRRHCMLQRQGETLLVVDMSSTNGTHLNDTRLIAYEPHLVAHGDRLILGTMHVVVVFSKLSSPLTD
ncbi:MAG: FHA domain-containing protein [Chloroflexi bacterium]|nr:FHA domain-containing protein [Chloroflexota bacterium]